jgi:hypothetical protein
LLWLFWRWGISWTICPGWLRTFILSISASQAARIPGVPHGYLAEMKSLEGSKKIIRFAFWVCFRGVLLVC